MKDNWSFAGSLTEALKDFKLKLKAWNKSTFGNIFLRKKRNTLRLEKVKKALDKRVSRAFLKLERVLLQERQELLKQEELLWLQKSRMD